MQKLLLNFLLLCSIGASAQTTTADSIAKIEKAKEKAKQDSSDKAFLAKATYPLLKTSKFSGIIPVANPSEKLDSTLSYKLLLEVVTGIKDTTEAKEINFGFAEAGRIINLHVGGGVPPKNLHTVLIVHGGSIKALLKNDAYQALYKMNNPNLDYLHELMNAGVQILVCGQAMFFLNVNRQDLMPGVKVALSAKTVLTAYQMKGYVLHPYL
ncbi:MAG TPA: DsrE family protein [Chitinophagaceae bacterium]|nr:DsrE family protein [Chitinophagaceae bacterium]